MEKRLKVGEIVWAKIRGFPWWPGMIGKIEESTSSHIETKVLINFIGDPTHANVQISKIEKFDKKFDEYSKTKKRSLLNSIMLAKKIIKGELTYNNHLNNQKDNRIRGKGNNINADKCDGSDDESSCDESDRKLLNHKRSRTAPNEWPTEGGCNIKGSGNLINPKVIVSDDKVDEDDDCREDSVEEEDDPCEEFKKRVDGLVFFKVYQPLSTSNKSITNNIEVIINLLDKIDMDKICYESIIKLVQYLDCIVTNKNQNVSSKSCELINLIKNKLIIHLFDDCTNVLKNINKHQFKSEDKIFLSSHLHKINHNQNLLTDNSTININTTDISLSRRESSLPKNKKIKDHSHTHIVNNLLLSKTNSSRELIITQMEENNSLSEISINSSRTDCEETRQKK